MIIAYIVLGIVALSMILGLVYHFQSYIFLALLIGTIVSVIYKIEVLGWVCGALIFLLALFANSYDKYQHTLDHKNRR
jgi:hypothetical protein